MHADSLDWRTSTYSGSNGESCVEVAFTPDGGTALRDTKNRALTPHHYPTGAWTAFLTGIRAGEFTSR